MEKNMMGEECSKYELEERRIQVFGRETWGQEGTWETQAEMGE
jgi:hypothetical protein